ncbi:cell surface protein [Methylocystis bryophila]|uniref:Cell surface protein n=1 Tax=Methylocystis bryophila TaxID=655015 RepID=A0A1W6MYU6_9HYPH|nr:cell surface protein [Methylocystis bryophila]ARN82752.1 cell surface protein [Methylocystis bryophila]BDV38990.1 merozoite surface protein 3b [Methylocystis bryophila]
MNTPPAGTPIQYLDRATGALRDLGIMPPKVDFTPINVLLDQITELDKDRVAVIARTLSQTEVFNEVVRDQTQAMDIGQRYEDIAKAFNSIRDDSKAMVDQLADGKIDLFERVANVWMKIARGDIASRFEEIRKTYLAVTRSTKDQIEREAKILQAYQDFRGALKQAQVLALEVLKEADGKLEGAKAQLAKAAETLSQYKGEDLAERARLELGRDEKLRGVQDEDKRYQIAKDLADNLTIGYNTSEVIMARLNQTTSAKERVYAQAVSFFATNDSVLTALKASFTGLAGLHESTQTLETMKEGVSRSIEVLSELGDKVQEAALRAGYGPTIRSDAVVKLVDSITNFQEKTFGIVQEMRKLSTQNAHEIEAAVEDGRKRVEKLILDGKNYGLNV